MADDLKPLDPAPKPAPATPQERSPSRPSGEYLSTLARGMALLLGAGASLGLALWEIVFSDLMVIYIRTNQIELATRRLVLAFGGVGIAIPLIALGIYGWVRRGQPFEAARKIEALGWKLSPLCVAFAVPLLFRWQIWKGKEVQFLLIVLIIALIAQKLFQRSLSEPPLLGGRLASLRQRTEDAFERWSPWLPWVLVLGLFVFYASYFSFFTLRNHWNLRTAAYDMAIEDNVVFNLMRGEFFKSSPIFGHEGSHFGFHATLFGYVLVPFYAMAPRPETLLIIQAVLIGGAAIPLFLFAKNRLGSYQGALLAAMYLFYAPLHGANLYDFHYPPLGIGFVFWVAYLVDVGKYRWAILPLLLSLSVREDMALSIFVVGAYFLLSRTKPRAGLALSVIGIGYFVIMKMGVMPYLRHGEHAFVWFYKDLIPEGGPGGFAGVLLSIVGNPGYAVGTLLKSAKIKYFLLVLVPFVFLPFRRPIGFLFCIPGMIMTLLSSRGASYDIGFQYTTHWALEMFIASVAVLTMIKAPTSASDQRGGTRVWSWLIALTLAMAATSYQHGAILQHHTARGGYAAFKFERSERDIKRYENLMSLVPLVPPEAKIAGTEKVLPHVSNRPDAYTIRTAGIRDAEFILFPFNISGTESKRIYPVVEDGTFGVVEVAGEFILAKRGYPSVRNPEVVKRLRKPPAPRKAKPKAKPKPKAEIKAQEAPTLAPKEEPGKK